MATPTIPALLDLTQYGITLSPGSYESLVADTLGNTAHPSDGFEAKLAESAARHQAALDALPAMDADVLAMGTAAAHFDTHPGADMARQLQPVSDAIDADLTAFVGQVLPKGPPVSPVAPNYPTLLPRPIMGGAGTTIPGTGLPTPIGPTRLPAPVPAPGGAR